MGDDIPDIKMMKVSGDFCLSAKFCSRSESYFRLYFSNLWWKGAVRDVIEQVMKVQGNWEEMIRSLFKWESFLEWESQK